LPQPLLLLPGQALLLGDDAAGEIVHDGFEAALPLLLLLWVAAASAAVLLRPWLPTQGTSALP
jgi:hypothetical protein